MHIGLSLLTMTQIGLILLMTGGTMMLAAIVVWLVVRR